MHVGAIINFLLKTIQTGDLVTQFITHRHFTGDALTLKLRYIFKINILSAAHLCIYVTKAHKDH